MVIIQTTFPPSIAQSSQGYQEDQNKPEDSANYFCGLNKSRSIFFQKFDTKQHVVTIYVLWKIPSQSMTASIVC